MGPAGLLTGAEVALLNDGSRGLVAPERQGQEQAHRQQGQAQEPTCGAGGGPISPRC